MLQNILSIQRAKQEEGKLSTNMIRKKTAGKYHISDKMEEVKQKSLKSFGQTDQEIVSKIKRSSLFIRPQEREDRKERRSVMASSQAGSNINPADLRKEKSAIDILHKGSGQQNEQNANPAALLLDLKRLVDCGQIQVDNSVEMSESIVSVDDRGSPIQPNTIKFTDELKNDDKIALEIPEGPLNRGSIKISHKIGETTNDNCQSKSKQSKSMLSKSCKSKLKAKSSKKKKQSILNSTKRKEPQKGCRWLDLFFFTSTSKLFDKGNMQELKEDDLFTLAPSAEIRKLVRKFDRAQSLKLWSFGGVIFYENRQSLTFAMIFKVFEQAMNVSLPFLTTEIVKTLKITPIDYKYIAWITTLSAALAFFGGICKEHSGKFISQVKARTGQQLRGIFFSHLITANYSFLKNVDVSFIAKMSIYEFDAIINFVGSVPEFLSFPITFTITMVLIILQVGKVTVSMAGLFMVAIIILGILNRRIIVMAIQYKKIGSIRTHLLTEVTSDMKSIKINSWEDLYQEKLKDLRKQEVKLLNSISFSRAMTITVIFLTPLLCSLLIISLDVFVNGDILDAVVCLAVVSMLSQLQKPLRTLAGCVDLYIDFEIGHKSLSDFFKLVSQKPINDLGQPWLERGEIKIFNCTGCIEEDLKIHRIIGKIFNRRGEKEANNEDSQLDLHPNKTLTTAQSPTKKTQNRKKSLIYRQNRPKQNTNLAPFEEKKLLERRRMRLFSQKPALTPGENLSKKSRFHKAMSPSNNYEINHNFMQIMGVTQANDRLDSKGRIMLHMDVNFEVRPGEVVCLMGNDDSGCSGLLLSIMEETYIIQGKLEVLGTFAYINLKNLFFIENRNLRDNIILSEVYVKQRYEQVLQVCDLDVSRFPGEDMVEVVENGKNFSSQERKKIVLARFLYSERDIYLFDYYFDDIDVYQDRSKFRNVVKEFLKQKTVVFRSNKEEFVNKSDYIYIFDAGTMVDAGTLKEISESKKGYFKNYLIAEIKPSLFRKQTSNLNVSNFFSKNLFLKKMSNQFDNKNISKETKKGLFKLISNINDDPEENKQKLASKLFNTIATVHTNMVHGKITTDNESLMKRPMIGLFIKYVFLLGYARIFLLLIIFLLSVGGLLFTDIWLGIWAENLVPKFGFKEYLAVYFAASMGSGLLILIREMVFHTMLRKNSDRLHIDMIEKLFNTNMSWFIHNPSSRISFRFSRDQLILDDELNIRIQKTFDSLVMLLGALVILNYIYFGVMAIITIFLIVYSYFVLKKYLRVIQSLCEILAEKKSMLQNMYLRSSLDSIHYRELCMLPGLRDRFYKISNSFQQVSTHLHNYSQRWLGMKILPMKIFLTISFFVIPAMLKIYLPEIYLTSNWKLALSIVWSVKMIGYYEAFFLEFCTMLQYLVSVGRIFNYLEHTEIEWGFVQNLEGKASSNNKKKASKEIKYEAFNKACAPSYAIRAEKLCLKYGRREAIKGITFEIPRRGRVAILGYAGSGKHSLMNVIMGLYKKTSGTIQMFGNPIEDYKPKSIRKLGFYLSQDPSLFGTTVRECIDPTDRFNTADLVNVLAILGLFEQVKSNIKTLQELDEWKLIKNDESKKMQLIVNISEYLKKSEAQDSNIINFESDHEPIRPSNFGNKDESFVKSVYEGLIADIILNKNAEGKNIDFEEEKKVPQEIRRLKEGITRSKQGIMSEKGESLSKSPYPQFASKPGTIISNMSSFKENKDNLLERLLSQKDASEYENEVIKNFLELKIHSHGANIPWSMKKLIIIAKAIMVNPMLIFIDDTALDLGMWSNWENMYVKMDNIFYDSIIFGMLNKIDHLFYFDHIIYLEDGVIVEQGRVGDLIKNSGSLISKKVKMEDLALYRRMCNKFGVSCNIGDPPIQVIKDIHEEEEEEKCSSSSSSELYNKAFIGKQTGTISHDTTRKANTITKYNFEKIYKGLGMLNLRRAIDDEEVESKEYDKLQK